MANILLIEPDRLLGNIYARTLEVAGHEVTTVTSAQAGIAAADNKTPEVVILEIQLVKHSGIEFLYEFRSYIDWQNIPILVHSQVPPSEFNGSSDLFKNGLGIKTYLYKLHTSLRELLFQVQETIPAVL